MQVSPELLQFIGSLVAILLLAALARGLRLGPTPILSSEQQAREAAQEAVDGFVASAIALDGEGRGALLCDAANRVLLLRPHGTHFAGRILSPEAKARIVDGAIVVDTAERRYGSASLRIPDPQAWVQRIEAIG